MTDTPSPQSLTEEGIAAFWRDFWHRQQHLLDTGWEAGNREIAAWIKAQLPRLAHWNILDIGAGTGGLAGELSRRAGQVVALDVALDALVSNHLRFGAGLAYLNGSGLSLPLQDRSMDLVYSFGLLEHFSSQDQVRLLRECARVSRQAVIVGVPNGECWFYRLGRFWLEQQGRWEFGEEEALGSLQDLFTAAGLEMVTETSLLHDWALDYLARLPGAARVVEIAQQWRHHLPYSPFPGYLRVALGQPAPDFTSKPLRTPFPAHPSEAITPCLAASGKPKLRRPRPPLILLACPTHYDLRTVGCLIREFGLRDEVLSLGPQELASEDHFWERFGRPFDRTYEAPVPGTIAGFPEALAETVEELEKDLALVVVCAPGFQDYPSEIMETEVPLLVLQPNKEYTLALQTSKRYYRTVQGPRWLPFYRDEDPHCHNIVAGFHFADYMTRQPKRDWRIERGFDPHRPIVAILPFPSQAYQPYAEALGLHFDSALAWTEALQHQLPAWLDEGFQFLVRLHPHFPTPEWADYPSFPGLRIMHGEGEWEEDFDFCDGVALITSSAVYYSLLFNATGLAPPKPILDLVLEERLDWNINANLVEKGLATAWQPGQELREVWQTARATFPPRAAYRQAAYPLIYHPDGLGLARIWRLIERIRAGEEITHYA